LVLGGLSHPSPAARRILDPIHLLRLILAASILARAGK